MNDSSIVTSTSESVVTIHAGDCIELMASALEPGTVDLVFADPPYNLSGKGLSWRGNTTGGDWFMVDSSWDKMTPDAYLSFTRAWIGGCRTALRSGGSMFVCCTFHNLGEVLLSLKDAGLRLNNVITWYKSNAMPNMTKRTFTHACEYLVWAAAGSGWTFDYARSKELNPEVCKDGRSKQMRDLWTFPLCQGKERLRRTEDGRALHPTQKPEALVARVLEICSRPGDLIVDPFVGSGTTAVVARRLGRRFVGFEKDATYVAAARRRIIDAMENTPRV